MALGMEVGLGPGHIVRDGDPAPLLKQGQSSPIFDPCLLWPNGWMDQDATWYGGKPRPGDIVLDRDPVHPKRSTAPNFRPMSVVAKHAAGWIKMPHRMEVGLGPGNFVLDGDPPFPPQKGAVPPPTIFGPCLLWPNGRIDQDGTWHGGGPRSRPHCARWGPSSPPHKKGQSSPIFDPCLLWPNGWMDKMSLGTEVSLGQATLY